MTDKELLLYIYGYLNGVLNMSKIPSDKIKKLKEIILLQQARKKDKLRITTNYDDVDDEEFEEQYRHDFFRDDTYSNDKYYNENLDLDQQDPDFYC